MTDETIDELAVGRLYSNDEIFRSLKVSNAGGIRTQIRDGAVVRAVIMTSEQGLHGAHENPYRDRLEGSVLTYTAAGKSGEQALSGMNSRLVEQAKSRFPVHGFALTASRRDRNVGPRRWRYLGLLEYLRHYPDTQLGSDGKVRKVWLFELRIHPEQQIVPLAFDAELWQRIQSESGRTANSSSDDDEIVNRIDESPCADIEEAEGVRSRLLVMEPRRFEYFVRDLLVDAGFADVCVTRFSADGGVDVTARAGGTMWMLEKMLVQVQAKRWLHSVGRKEVAELRGSLQPFARGAVVTTGYFSKAAINEACEPGKNPIVLVDGFRLSQVVLARKINLP